MALTHVDFLHDSVPRSSTASDQQSARVSPLPCATVPERQFGQLRAGMEKRPGPNPRAPWQRDWQTDRPMRLRRTYYEPEDLGREQARRDAADPNRRFYGYVLETDYGHYVGHTAHVGARLRQDRVDEAESTAGQPLPDLDVWTACHPQGRRRVRSGDEAAEARSTS